MSWEKGKIKEYEQNILYEHIFLKAKKHGKVIQKG